MSQPAKIPYREAMNPDHGVGDGARWKSTSEYANRITCHAGKRRRGLSDGADSGRANRLCITQNSTLLTRRFQLRNWHVVFRVAFSVGVKWTAVVFDQNGGSFSNPVDETFIAGPVNSETHLVASANSEFLAGSFTRSDQLVRRLCV